MPLSAAHRLSVHFGHALMRAVAPVPAPAAVLEEPMAEDLSENPALLGPVLRQPEFKPVMKLPAEAEAAARTSAEPDAPAGPMAEFGAAEVLRWLETVEGLTGAERAAIGALFGEGDYIGQDLLEMTERSLSRLLRGVGAAGAAPAALLAARNKHLADAAPDPVAATEPEPAATPVTPPGEYTCPISHELMVDPVFTATGQTYEREFITQWLRSKQTDPISNARLPNKKLVPNFALRGLILQWKEAHPEYTS